MFGHRDESSRPRRPLAYRQNRRQSQGRRWMAMDGDGRQSGLASSLHLGRAERGNPLSWDKSGFIGALCNPAANGTDGTTARDATGPGGKARGGLRDGAERPAARAPHRTRNEGRCASPVPPGDTLGQGDAAPKPSLAWAGVTHTKNHPRPRQWRQGFANRTGASN